MNNKDLSGEQRRQLIDAQQAWRAWRQLNADKRRRFTGGMRWATRKSGEYLLRKTGTVERSLRAGRLSGRSPDSVMGRLFNAHGPRLEIVKVDRAQRRRRDRII